MSHQTAGAVIDGLMKKCERLERELVHMRLANQAMMNQLARRESPSAPVYLGEFNVGGSLRAGIKQRCMVMDYDPAHADRPAEPAFRVDGIRIRSATSKVYDPVRHLDTSIKSDARC